MSTESIIGRTIITMPKLSAEDRVHREDFKYQSQFGEELAYARKQDKLFRKLLEVRNAGNIGELILGTALSLRHNEAELRRAEQTRSDLTESLNELSAILELGGSLIVRPRDGETLKVWGDGSRGYYETDEVRRTLTDSEKFVGNHLRWTTQDDEQGQLILYGGYQRKAWVNLSVTEEGMNFVIDEVVLPEIIEETQIEGLDSNQ